MYLLDFYCIDLPTLISFSGRLYTLYDRRRILRFLLRFLLFVLSC
jgi:hypothetical protein